MCEFVEALESIKSSSSASVANKDFSSFNEYMHIETDMDQELSEVISLALSYHKSLVLVCGNSGDGKSHLIANLIAKGIICEDKFNIYIDATSSDKKGMLANAKLKEKLSPFSDLNITDQREYRLIVAINLGVLNDFLKNSEEEFKILAKYIHDNRLFDNLPTWEVEYNKSQRRDGDEGYFISHVDFTEYHRYSISREGAGSSFVNQLLSRIVDKQEANEIYRAYTSHCLCCPSSGNCPTCHNYTYLMKDSDKRKMVSDILVKAIIKNNLAPSVREVNDFFYECIVGSTFDESKNRSTSVDRLIHFIHNSIMWNMYEGVSGLKSYVAQEDILNEPGRICDDELIRLNLLPSFEDWLVNEASAKGDFFEQVEADVKYCTNNYASKYRKIESEIKRDVYKVYLRETLGNLTADDDYKRYVYFLFQYNIGEIEECEELYNLVVRCFCLWNGRLLNSNSELVSNAVIAAQGSENYCLYKKIELEYYPEDIEPIAPKGEYWKFSPSIKFKVAVKGTDDSYEIDIDYDLYRFFLKIDRGYQPTASDRKARVKFDTFVRKAISKSTNEVHVYSYRDSGKRYIIKKRFIGKYVFEEEQ